MGYGRWLLRFLHVYFHSKEAGYFLKRTAAFFSNAGGPRFSTPHPAQLSGSSVHYFHAVVRGLLFYISSFFYLPD
jgi:hypothetical protein